MADDLIIKYFREDLTEEEEGTLNQTLGSSTDEAYRFFQHAEAAYRYCGLPEPRMPPGRFPPGYLPGGGFKPGLWLLLCLVTGLSTWGLWRYETIKKEATLVSMSPLATLSTPASKGLSLPTPEKIPVEKVSAPPQPVESPVSSDAPGEKPVSNGSFAPAPAGVEAIAPAGALPGITPVNLLSRPHLSHSNLEVIVRRKTQGQVMVRVLDFQGGPKVLLYQGSLQAGSWIFDWDGNLGDGQKAPAGIYQIEVASGKFVQRKKVVIHKK